MPQSSVRRITSRQHALVARFRSAARRARDVSDPVVVEGATLIQEARRAGCPLEVVALSTTTLGSPEGAALLARLDGAVEVVTAPDALFAVMSPARTPSGAVALVRRPARTLDETFLPAPALVVVAVDVQDPGNLGAIVRVAEAAGATGVIAAGASADPFGWKALRGAMGSAFRLPVVRLPDADKVLSACRARRVQIAATTLAGSSVSRVDFRGPTAVLVGSEGHGLPPALAAAADVTVTVPMAPPVESLNVAVAAGVLLYEARRQRAQGSGVRDQRSVGSASSPDRPDP